MAKLKDVHKVFITSSLACYYSPTKVKELVQETFDLDISTSQIVYYNPETNRSGDLSEKWVRLYYDTRRQFVEGNVDIPITHKRYRLQTLQQTLEQFRTMKNLYGILQTLEQAAKEVGGMYEQNKALPPTGGLVNFYQQINQKITQVNEKKNGKT
jgi:hypothetical protein